MPNSLGIRALHHVSLVVKNLETTRAFYRDVLGFAEIPRPAFNFEGAWLYGYGLQIHLIVSAPHTAAVPTMAESVNTRGDHIAFEVADERVIEQTLTAHGIAFKANVQASTQVRQIFCRDPDGHAVEFAVYGPTKTEGSWM